MISITLDEDFTGPDIFELQSIISTITDPVIRVNWTNTKDEIHALTQYKRDFILSVSDLQVFDRTVATFGKRITISKSIIERAKLVLADKKNYDWRNFAAELRETSPRYLLIKLAADAIRRGTQPSLAEIVGKMLHLGINPNDADVLMRLRSPRLRG